MDKTQTIRKAVLSIIAALVIISGCSKTENEQPANEPVLPLTIAVFGNAGCAVDGGKTLKKLAEAVNTTDAGFVVDLGNRLSTSVSSSGIYSLWDAVDKDRDLFATPMYTVVGKNDIFDFESDVAYSRNYGPLWYTFTRNGVRFIVLDTEDESYRYGFGDSARLSSDQAEWLKRTLNESDRSPAVVFMHRPLWKESPELWSSQLRPILESGDVDLIVTCYENGLFDWDMIDGIRAVSTGCTGPVRNKNIGLFPHVLLITLNEDDLSFRVLSPDGISSEGIGINSEISGKVEKFTTALLPPVLEADNSWRVSESVRITLYNDLSVPVSGNLNFSVFDNTSWKINPAELSFSIDPQIKKTFHVNFLGTAPELGPLPTFHAELRVGDTPAFDYKGTVNVHIPRPRTIESVPVSARIADIVPYAFAGKPLGIPVEIERADLCGRLVIYREGRTELPVCLHISALKDFKPGLNELYWNGRGLEGEFVPPDSLTYRVIVYNKKAPQSWIANGSPDPGGTVIIERTLTGLIAKTHDSRSLFSYRIEGSIDNPKFETVVSCEEVLDGLPLVGFAYGEKNRVYMVTSAGVVCGILNNGNVMPYKLFGDEGYKRFPGYRGRRFGSPVYSNGQVYIGIGGEDFIAPCIVALDGTTGETVWNYNLDEFYGEEPEPPAITASERGFYCMHPDGEYVIHFSHSGDLLWITGTESYLIGSDSDGRNFTYGIGVDRHGFSYVNTPGYSARCGVLGPDGRGLFRVIQVQLPGLRVSSVVPMIEGKETDGLYFVTRGGDVPYIFHVPYTVKKGVIVDEAEFLQ
ncbi:metallophosphoesterase family protein [Candidatus Latescibacterota bacterium]